MLTLPRTKSAGCIRCLAPLVTTELLRTSALRMTVQILLLASKVKPRRAALCMHRAVLHLRWIAWLVSTALMVMQRARMSPLAKLVAPPMMPRRVSRTPSMRRAPRSRWDALQVHTGLQTTMLPIASTFLRARWVTLQPPHPLPRTKLVPISWLIVPLERSKLLPVPRTA